MLNNEAQAASANILQGPVSVASTAAASGNWMPVTDFEGDIVFIQQTGALTGSYLGGIEHAQDSSGTGATAITFNEGALASVPAASANIVQKRTVSANAIGGFVRNRGTVTTGPALISVTMMARSKTQS